jgi:hypothetical protein
MTDAISPEFRLEPTGPGSFKWDEWQIDDEHVMMFHEPTRALFSIYPAPGTDPAAMNIYQVRARLVHADRRPLSSCATYGRTFMPRRSSTKSATS